MGWTAGSRVGSQIAQFAITAFLARLLVPADFGLVQMYVVFTGFAMLFVDLGFVGALVQRKEIDERHLSSAFWLNLASSTGVAVLIAALSPALAAFYGESQLVPLTIVVSTLSSWFRALRGIVRERNSFLVGVRFSPKL